MEKSFQKYEEIIETNLCMINKNIFFNYNIFCKTNMFPMLVKFGKNSKERLQIFIMCCITNCTLKEVKNWSLDEVIKYFKNTYKDYKKNEKYINKCIELIEMETIDKCKATSDIDDDINFKENICKKYIEENYLEEIEKHKNENCDCDIFFNEFHEYEGKGLCLIGQWYEGLMTSEEFLETEEIDIDELMKKQ